MTDEMPVAMTAPAGFPAARAWRIWQALSENEMLLATHAVCMGYGETDLRLADAQLLTAYPGKYHIKDAFKVRDFLEEWRRVESIEAGKLAFHAPDAPALQDAPAQPQEAAP